MPQADRKDTMPDSPNPLYEVLTRRPDGHESVHRLRAPDADTALRTIRGGVGSEGRGGVLSPFAPATRPAPTRLWRTMKILQPHGTWGGYQRHRPGWRPSMSPLP